MDDSFLARDGGANNLVHAISAQSDGKILIGGDFTTYNGTSQGHIARLNTDGSLDTGFFNSGIGANAQVLSFAVQADGKIVVGGNFATYNGTSRRYLARLNADGSLDTSFCASGVGPNGAVLSVVLQDDGKAIIGGFFNTYNGTSRGYVARLNADGSLDTSFLASGVGANAIVEAIAVQPDGKIVIVGQFSAYNDIARGYIARLNPDGSLDTGFLASDVGASAGGDVYAVALQGDGKIVIGGGFSSYNGISRGHVARLNTDGSLDTGFLDSGTGANNYVYSVVLQSDGKILLGGSFTSYNGASRGYVARLNTDGTLDTSFLSTGTGANNEVITGAVQGDGKVLIGGFFNSFDGSAQGYIARLWN